jgi:hypothetical protein
VELELSITLNVSATFVIALPKHQIKKKQHDLDDETNTQRINKTIQNRDHTHEYSFATHQG